LDSASDQVQQTMPRKMNLLDLSKILWAPHTDFLGYSLPTMDICPS